MATYKFKLEKVLEWREDGEKQEAKAFAVIINELQGQEEALEKLKITYEKIKADILKLRNINEIKQQYMFKQMIENQIEAQLILIENTKLKLEKQRLELLEAQKNRKIMEKLKEKDYSLYQENMLLAEQKELDEMAVLKHRKTI